MPSDSTFAMRLRYHAPALAEADPRIALAAAMAAQDHLVARLQEAPRLAARQRQRLGAAPGELDQAAAVLLRRPRDGAARDQVAGAQVAAVRAVVRDPLREGPVDVAQVAAAQRERRQAALAHQGARQQHLELQVHAAAGPVLLVVEVRQRLRILGRTLEGRHAERRERLERHHPRADRGREALGEERAERLVLPLLQVASGPVVEQAQAEELALGLRQRDRLAERVAGPEERADLELVVERSARAEARLAAVGGLRLALRACDGRAAH